LRLETLKILKLEIEEVMSGVLVIKNLRVEPLLFKKKVFLVSFCFHLIGTAFVRRIFVNGNLVLPVHLKKVS
jgi:hypothetical protein